MSKSQIQLYYKNVMADVIGQEHGITKDQLKELTEKTKPIIGQLNKEKQENIYPYRNLPYKTDISDKVKKIAADVKGCENFVVLGIGGSALGNIALQTALNPYTYNLDESVRKGGPRLFVFDNVDPEQLGAFLDWISDKLDRTIFNVISKSGRTAETASQFLIISKLLKDKLGDEGYKRQVLL